MSKKKSKIIITFLVIAILLISICGFYIYNYIKEHNIYSNIIRENWNIELSSEYKEIYSDDSGGSFLGDGERYHVFEYIDCIDIEKSLDWKSDKNAIMEANVLKILSSLNVPSEKLPNFEEEYKYYSKKDGDSSKLYIVFLPAMKMVYVIEDFQ